MAVTIKHIADATGVSRGTVDRVLHERPGVKPEVIETVRKAAADLGYVPSRAGKILAQKKQPLTVGCLLTSVGNPFFADVIAGIRSAESELMDFGVSVKVLEIEGYNHNEHLSSIKALVDEGCAALCLNTMDVEPVREYINELTESGIPVICLNTDISGSRRLCYVGGDYLNGGRTAAGLLSKMTNEFLSVLIVTGSLKIMGHNERIEGFLQTLKRKKMPHEVVSVVESQDNELNAYEIVLEALKLHPETNCLYVTAAGTAGAGKAIEELGLIGRLIVLSHDDVPATREYVKKGIIDFTICQEPFLQGYHAIQTVFDYFMSNRKKAPQGWMAGIVIKIKENL